MNTRSVEHETDAALLRRCEQREIDALAELYDRYSARVFGFAIATGCQVSEAEAAVEESFLTLWQYAARWPATTFTVEAWLLALMQRVCRSRLCV